MKKVVILSLSALILTACGDTANRQLTQQNVNANKPSALQNQNNSLIVSSHKSETINAPAANTPNQSAPQQMSPNQQPVDVSEMTAKIEKADKEYKAKPNDTAAKQALADAYFERAFVLTKAAQYRAALGDFRKGLKLKPDDTEAKDMHDQIINIFKSIGRQPPKEGEEPPPLPFKKQ